MLLLLVIDMVKKNLSKREELINNIKLEKIKEIAEHNRNILNKAYWMGGLLALGWLQFVMKPFFDIILQIKEPTINSILWSIVYFVIAGSTALIIFSVIVSSFYRLFKKSNYEAILMFNKLISELENETPAAK
jgi:hypothetical protein